MSSGSWASSEGVQRSMRSNRGRDTSPEMAVRRAVWARGMRYRVDTRPLPELNRRADLVFRQERVAVFVDGCYWHSCPIHATRPSTNSVFWALKLENTIARRRRRSRRCDRTGRARPHPIDRLRGESGPIRLAPAKRSVWQASGIYSGGPNLKPRPIPIFVVTPHPYCRTRVPYTFAQMRGEPCNVPGGTGR